MWVSCGLNVWVSCGLNVWVSCVLKYVGICALNVWVTVVVCYTPSPLMNCRKSWISVSACTDCRMVRRLWPSRVSTLE